MELIAALPRLDCNSHPGTKILYNPDLTFSRRLYGEFDVDIRRCVPIMRELRVLGSHNASDDDRQSPSI
jgi:hypothetical protein